MVVMLPEPFEGDARPAPAIPPLGGRSPDPVSESRGSRRA